jgi:hypothetical protein
MTASAKVSPYENMDEIGRLMMSIDKMNLDNTSPLFGVDKAADLGFAEAVHHAKVRRCQPDVILGEWVATQLQGRAHASAL